MYYKNQRPCLLDSLVAWQASVSKITASSLLSLCRLLTTMQPTLKESYFLFLIGCLTCSSCSLSRNLPADTFLYKGAKLKTTTSQKTEATKDLDEIYQTLIKRPKPNKRFLGLRVGWLGKPAVIYDEQITNQTKDLLENRALNNGFFQAKISAVVKKKKKKARVKYQVNLGTPFTIASYHNGITDSLLQGHVERGQNGSLVKLGLPYKLNLLKKERERIALDLRQHGIYFFRADYLKFKADTSTEKGKVQLELVLKDQLDSSKLKPQTIKQVFVFPDLHAKETGSLPKDTIQYEGLTIIYQEEHIRFSRLREVIAFKVGTGYSVEKYQNTLKRLSALRNYQFIDIQFEAAKDSDTSLNVMIQLTPRKKETIEGSLGLSLKSGLYFGPEISLTYLNRNLFRGAEQLRLTAIGNYNFPLGQSQISLQEQGLELELSTPALMLPFRKKPWSQQIVGKSKVVSSFSNQRVQIPLKNAADFLEEGGFTDLLARLTADSTFAPAIALNDFDLRLSYQWRKHLDIQHELTPIELVLQIPKYEVLELRKLLLDLISLSDDSTDALFLNLEEMLILKPSYTLLYDSRLKRVKVHNNFYRGKIAVSGNVLLSRDNLIPKANSESQFLQWEHDFRHYWKYSSGQTLALRLAANVSIPLSNEIILPFFDLYNIGGPNSVRAFRPRLVGPGSVVPDGNTFFFSGTGDILLESSLEWRSKITNLVELGLFLDAGNVWLFKGGNSENKLAQFQFDKFFNQLALGTGAGLRFDLNILLLRFDFAFPLAKPWLPEGQRWVGGDIRFGNAAWRRENLTFNLAFGYAF